MKAMDFFKSKYCLWFAGALLLAFNCLASADLSRMDGHSYEGEKMQKKYFGKQQKLVIGPGFAIGVREDGSVWSWGRGLNGELGQGPRVFKSIQPKKIEQLHNIVEVAYVMNHILALRSDGMVFGWGRNQYLQLGRGGGLIESPVLLQGFKDIEKIAVTASGSVFLDKKGQVFYLGKPPAGLGLDDTGRVSGVKEAGEASPVSLISDISGFGLIFPGGRIRYIGKDYLNGTLIRGVESLSVLDLCLSANGAVFLTPQGSVYAAAVSRSEILGQGKEIRGGGFYKLPNLKNIKKIAYAGGSALALDAEGTVWQWGQNVESLPDPGGMGVSRVYSPRSFFNIAGVTDIYAGPLSSAVFLSDGSVYFMGSGDGGVRNKEWQDHYPSKKEWIQPEKINWTWK